MCVHIVDFFFLWIATKGEPIPQRPVTTDMVARRLVHGALGMKRPTRTREQLQQEKDMLQSIRGKLNNNDCVKKDGHVTLK